MPLASFSIKAKSFFIIALLMATGIIFFGTLAYKDHLEIASFLEVSPLELRIECKGQRYEVTQNNTLKFCLRKDDNAKRCEIAIHNLEHAPQTNHIDFSFRLNGDLINPDQFFGILQIHALPDKDEAWRCPNFTYDIIDGYMSVYNRWDALPLSKTVNGTCINKENSIKGRSLLPEAQKMTADQWHNIRLQTALSHQEDGQTTLDFNGLEPQNHDGANIYNDKRMPYLKLGVYKPTPWTHEQEEICVEYKDVELSSRQP